MQWTVKKTIAMARRWCALSARSVLCIVAIATLATFWLPVTHAEETETLLRWQNGDTLPGQLQESNSATLRWASPYFLDDLMLDMNVLDSVVFRKTPNPATETFRVSTVSGDVWIADLIAADDNTFLFSSKRHGQFRVKRSAVFKLERQGHLNYLFDGSQLTNWRSAKSAKNIDDPTLLIFHESSYYDWHQDDEGRPQTNRKNAHLFQPLKWPKYFEIDLALEFTEHPPSFVFALGKNLDQALALTEVWSNKSKISHLVAIQGKLFKTVLTIQPEQHSLYLRLTYDESIGMLRVFDGAGNLLLDLDGVKPTVRESGLYIRNKGDQGLKVRELKVYDYPVPMPTAQQIDLSKPRVCMTDGQIFQGELFVQQGSTYVLDIDGTRHTIDGQQVSRVIQPRPPSTASDRRAGLPSSHIKYHDKTVLHGKITHMNADSVVLQTDFADDPVTCSLAGAIQLHFNTTSETNQTVENKDRLFHAYGSLRGRVLFPENRGTSLVQWKSLGATKPVRLANDTAAHITRFLQSTSPLQHFDTTQFPHALHLQTGETFPCHITAYDGKSISFQSPFVSAQHLDPANMKALEFSDRTHATSIENLDKTQPAINNFESFRVTARGNGVVKMQLELVGKKKDGAKFIIDATDKVKLIDGNPVVIINEINAEAQPQAWMEIVPKDRKGLMALPADEWFGVIATPPDLDTDKPDPQLERALTVPRFNSNNPPNHILVANTDDIMRGQFLGFNGQTLQFDSKLRRFSVPIARVARVVDVSSRKAPPHENSGSLTPNASPQPLATQAEIRVTLIDGSTLIFQPLEIKDGKLTGRSSVYGEVSLPTSSIKYLHFGEKVKAFKAAFEKWVVHPAKTP